ncbi:hypothetical protein GCM10011578_038910 [Streptomyces fuscichromogenes]|uniref:Transposase n=1 Tax=Streptomyces fuscichromogenes TaxID=1324013 RepID=A0A917XDH8_9ACTN|nr:hypothetical protein GCM10011578_038910 [Streptomyces fuscichromogenes]
MDRGTPCWSRKVGKAVGGRGEGHLLTCAAGAPAAHGHLSHIRLAAMESFFSLLQRNVVDRRGWTTREELRIAIVTWIERTYHRRRRQAALGRPTPVEFETVMTAPALQAA